MAGKICCLVTGGSGFLGQHIVRQLLEDGKYDVTVFDIRESTLKDVKSIVGDLRKPEVVTDALKGIKVVFHCATASPTGENATNKQLMHSVNVNGTQNIIDACIANGVEKLLFTSSASVVFEGKHLYNVDESTPYAAHPMDYYTQTKIEGEKLVLAANGKQGLLTCALRPSGIFGEGDLVFVPTTIRSAQKGKLKYAIGDGKNEMDFTYVGNVAQAHLQAAAALLPSSPVAGQAYFITNNQPRPFWTMLGDICEGLGYKRPRGHLPFWLIFTVVCIFEYIVTPILKLFMKNLVVDFTVNRILIITTNRTFSTSKAQKHFQYKPKVPMEKAMERTLLSFAHLRADQQKKDI